MAKYSVTNPPRSTLKGGDTVIFCVNGKTYAHLVTRDHLMYKGDGGNDTIFSVLNIDPVMTCRSAYGYDPCGTGNWPESRHSDYAALTRAVWMLLGYCSQPAISNPLKYRPGGFDDGVVCVYTEDIDGVLCIVAEDLEHEGVVVAKLEVGEDDGLASFKMCCITAEQAEFLRLKTKASKGERVVVTK